MTHTFHNRIHMKSEFGFTHLCNLLDGKREKEMECNFDIKHTRSARERKSAHTHTHKDKFELRNNTDS